IFLTCCILMVIRLPSAAATASCCPTGWHMNQGNCYHVVETQESWNASQNRCLSLGATLAVFGDLEKLVREESVKIDICSFAQAGLPSGYPFTIL
uniref:C-type lectin domain-containing protein n=1 Tax=Laticauda laticaudata TaxID=8630 RepID=A0A8C5RYD0_LATLA